MGLFDFISEELALTRLSKKKLNTKKYKDLRYDYVRRAFTALLETEPKNKKGKQLSKSEAIQQVRKQTGLQFSNATGRQYFNELIGIKGNVYYAAKLGENTIPSDEQIPLIEYSIKGTYLYGFKVFLYDDNRRDLRIKKLPKNAVRINDNFYNMISDYVYFSDVKLTKKQANAIAYKILSGQEETLGTLRSHIEGSDYKNILKKNSATINGFKYDRLART